VNQSKRKSYYKPIYLHTYLETMKVKYFKHTQMYRSTILYF